MDEPPVFSFDTRGFFFAAKALVVGALLLTAGHYSAPFVMAQIEARTQVAAAAASEEIPAPAENVPSTTPPDAAPRFAVDDIPLPSISATSFIIGDLESGIFFASKDADKRHPIASITKLLTALTARDLLAPDERVSITLADRRQTEGTPGSIDYGPSFRADDLLYPLLMESNNSVAFALARTATTTVFMQKMNDIAREVGMSNTSLEEPSGLSFNNVATARDIFALTRHLFEEESELLAISRTQKKTITSTNNRRFDVPNFNVFENDARFIGGKIGYTDEALRTMTAAFEVPVESDTARIAIVVLGSNDHERDVKRLRDWFTKAVIPASGAQE